MKNVVCIFVLTCILAMSGCNRGTMDYTIENEMSNTGSVEEVYLESVTEGFIEIGYAVSGEEYLQSALDSAEQYAYLDPDSASPELRKKIIDARNTIIFSQDWVADGFTGYIQDVETGEILKELPSFSSVFPDWDIPILDPVTESEHTIDLSPPSMEAKIIPVADLDS